MYESLKEVAKENIVIFIVVGVLLISAIVLELALWIESIVKIIKNKKQNKLNKMKAKEED